MYEKAMTYDPKVGDEITFAKSEFNRATIYTVTDIDMVAITVTTPTHPRSKKVFTYRLGRGMFSALEPRTLEAA